MTYKWIHSWLKNHSQRKLRQERGIKSSATRFTLHLFLLIAWMRYKGCSSNSATDTKLDAMANTLEDKN